MNSLGITTYEQLRALPDKESRKTALSEELATQSIKELAAIWGCEVHNLYDMRRNLGLPSTRTLAPRTPKPETPKRAAAGTINTEKEIRKPMANPIELNSFSVRLVLTTKGEEISDRLMRIVDILNKDSNYQLTFEIKEIRLDPRISDSKQEESTDGGQADAPVPN